MESDKSLRILLLYSKLIRGLRIRKVTFCFEQHITARTFERYIEDIRLFLCKSYSGYELVYDRKEHIYYIRGIQKKNYLSGMEAAALIEILKGNGTLMPDEYDVLVDNIVSVTEKEKREIVESVAANSKEQYSFGNHSKGLLKLQWDLQQCIYSCNIIHLKYVDQTGQIQQDIICPIEIRFVNDEFYLLALDEENNEKCLFPLYSIESFIVSIRKYDPLLKRYRKEIDV